MIDRLVNLGLSSYEATAYLTLLKRGEASPVEVATKAKIPKQRVYDVLSSLHSKGFCLMKETTPKSYAAVDPKIALSRFRELEVAAFFESESRKKEESHKLAEKLVGLFEQGRVTAHIPPPIELFKEEGLMASRVLEMFAQAKQSISLTLRSSLAFRESHNDHMIDILLEKGLDSRVLIEEELLMDVSRRSWIEKIAKSAGEVRSLSVIPVKLSIVDDLTAFLAIPADEVGNTNFTGVVVSHPKTVEFLRFAFDQLWVQSKKIGAIKK
jgi:HTH-type transcriptional regulator, sugar sensing transcriptional regulator